MNRIFTTLIAAFVYGLISYFLGKRKNNKSNSQLTKKVISEAILFGILYYVFSIIIDKIW